jgi:TRAP-type C4-dicarboxylate transport system substrate-binding protein
VTKYYIPSNTHFEVWYLILNKETYDKLKPERKKALDDTSARFEARRWDSAKADQAANEKKLADYGAKIVPISDAEIDAIGAKIKKVVWPAVLKDVGAEWGQGVLDAIAD